MVGVIDEDAAVAMHYNGIKTIWRAVAPYIRTERQLLAAEQGGGFCGSFEHLAVYAESIPYSTLGARFPRRTFPPSTTP